jgi:hypothetical protein
MCRSNVIVPRINKVCINDQLDERLGAPSEGVLGNEFDQLPFLRS